MLLQNYTQPSTEFTSTQKLAIADLLKLDERRLQEEIIEPLLKKIGFQNVRDTSGRLEYGKDLIATKIDPINGQELYAIQIKKYKTTANVNKGKSYYRLLDQLRQALQEPVFDPSSGRKICPDRCLFITPYPISPATRDAFQGSLSNDPLFRLISVIDGIKLVDLLEKYLPGALTSLSMETQYRLHIAHEANRIKEAGVAFSMNGDLLVDSIYVEVALEEVEDLISQVSRQRRNEYGERFAIGYRNEIDLFEYTFRAWLLAPFKYQDYTEDASRRRSKDGCKDKYTEEALDLFNSLPKNYDGNTDQRQKIDNRVLIKANLDILFQKLHSEAIDFVTKAKKISEEYSQDLNISETFQLGVKLRNNIFALEKSYLFRTGWKERIHKQEHSSRLHGGTTINPRRLLDATIPLLVLGSPGAGKTTLLRRMTHLTANNSVQIPVFVPILSLKDFSVKELLIRCEEELLFRGFVKGKSEKSGDFIIHLLKQGKIRPFFDGIDEAGSNAKIVLDSLTKFAEQFPNSGIIASCRDTFDISYWQPAATIRLRPFTNEQIREFVLRWFSSEPSKANTIVDWLEKNNGMREAARRPIITALLCSIYGISAEMPSTEVDLYEARFDLLLGRWDRAKGILSLTPDMRRRYSHFLMRVAMRMHSQEKRVIARSKVLAIAQDCYDKNFHGTSDALIDDCIRRGVMEVETNSELSFGHLTYQEYLVAEWLKERDAIKEIWRHLEKDWWLRSLQFYAAKKQDITTLLIAAPEGKLTEKQRHRLAGLCDLAPLTEKIKRLGVLNR